MFGMRAFSAYQQAKEKIANAPHRKVTREEFIAAMVAAGTDRRRAALQADTSIALGSSVLVGGELLSIKKGK